MTVPASELPGIAVGPDDIAAAAARIEGHAHLTPVLTSESINAEFGAELFFKCENLQRCGAFKFRGACNAVMSMSDQQLQAGVATHSSGNHAAALTLAASLRSARATVVMPSNAAAPKRAAVIRYGGHVIDCEPTQEARERTLAEVVAREGCEVVEPFDDPRVIAGQGTAALELMAQVEGLETLLAPVGGGGLLSGTALAARGHGSSGPTVIGVEPAMADDTFRSFAAGERIPVTAPNTIADGLRTSVGRLTFPIIQRDVAQVLIVEEASIVAAMRMMWERLKIVVEPSGAVPLAALLERQLDGRKGRIGIIVSGGNVDLDRLPWS